MRVQSSRQVVDTAAEGHFVLEDWHAFGQHYDRTLALGKELELNLK